ncbi:hypothetical protein M9458_028665, partial [Cirrhinus mrigala]
MLVSVSESFHLEHLGRFDWQKSIRPGEGCPKKCHPERCPDVRQLQGCPAGLVRDQCGANCVTRNPDLGLLSTGAVLKVCAAELHAETPQVNPEPSA